MKERTKSVLKLVGLLIFTIVLLFGIYSIKRNTQVSPVGGKNEETAVKICQGDKIEIKVFIEKDDRMTPMYAYWDDNKNDKQKLKKGLFTAKCVIYVPNTLGVHKLTISKGLTKYWYYYEVVPGKSD